MFDGDPLSEITVYEFFMSRLALIPILGRKRALLLNEFPGVLLQFLMFPSLDVILAELNRFQPSVLLAIRFFQPKLQLSFYRSQLSFKAASHKRQMSVAP
jgi:hypothetical protein